MADIDTPEMGSAWNARFEAIETALAFLQKEVEDQGELITRLLAARSQDEWNALERDADADPHEDIT
jgi:hypothetical protein